MTHLPATAHSQHETHDSWNLIARGETPTQRLDRNYAELLQEIRVAQTGVQLLLAFLLSLAFTPKFGSLGEFDRGAFVASLVLGAAATALLIAPAPVHRLVFQHRLKRQLVHLTSGLALSGLVLLMLSLAFTPKFGSLGEFDRGAFVASLVLGAAATALLIAPAPVHRLVFQHRLKRQLVHLTSGLALSGLVLLMLSLASALMLILDVVLGKEWAGMLTAGIVSWFSLWWYVVPLWLRWRRGQSPRMRRRAVHTAQLPRQR
jgi:hypothetical protein